MNSTHLTVLPRLRDFLYVTMRTQKHTTAIMLYHDAFWVVWYWEGSNHRELVMCTETINADIIEFDTITGRFKAVKGIKLKPNCHYFIVTRPQYCEDIDLYVIRSELGGEIMKYEERLKEKTFTRIVETYFSAAHHIEGHPKCGVVHGHTYKVRVEVTSSDWIDLGDLRGAVTKIVARYDHSDLGDKISEELAAEIANELENLGQVTVEVWETPYSGVRYEHGV